MTVDAVVLEVRKIFLLDVGADFVTKIFDYFSDLLYQKTIELLGDFFSVMNATGYDLFGMPWVILFANHIIDKNEYTE